jgi:carbon monoxide dehydrogenase subunit G
MLARAFSRRACLLFAFMLAAMPSFLLAEEAIKVRVETQGSMLIVTADFTVRANVLATWQVLTDFDRMPRFLTGLGRSRIVSRKGNVLRVAQQGAASVGLLSFSYDSVRDIHLKPTTEIRAYTIGGSMKKMDSVTRLTARHGVTRVAYRAELIPGVALPLGMGSSVIEERTRQQFEEMRQEILRRAAGRGAITSQPT